MLKTGLPNGLGIREMRKLMPFKIIVLLLLIIVLAFSNMPVVVQTEAEQDPRFHAWLKNGSKVTSASVSMTFTVKGYEIGSLTMTCPSPGGRIDVYFGLHHTPDDLEIS